MSRVIFKMTFKHPNLIDTSGKNVAHINYIGTRSGVDKSVTEADLKKELEKGIEKAAADDETYVRYIDERPNSHGLFGAEGIEDIKEIEKEIANVNSYVWRGIISLREEDATKLGYLTKDAWQDLLRKKVPDMAEEMGIPISNLRWVGAVHMERGHPHAHLVIWEKEPRKTLGLIPSRKLDGIRKLFTDEVFEEERQQLLQVKNAERDLIRELAGDNVSKATLILKEIREEGKVIMDLLSIQEEGIEGIPPRLYAEEELLLAQKIQDLAELLPGKGRANLKFMPENVKEVVRGIADEIIKQPEFAASLAKSMNTVEELSGMYTGKDEAIEGAKEKAYQDLRDRISQVILRGAVELHRENYLYVDQELADQAVQYIENMNNCVDVIPEQKAVMASLTQSLLASGMAEGEIKRALIDFTVRENINLKDQELGQIISDAQYQEVSISSKEIDQHLVSLKVMGLEEREAFKSIDKIIENNSERLMEELDQLVEKGMMHRFGDEYILTKQGIEEFIQVKELDNVEREILKTLEKAEIEKELDQEENEDTVPRLDFKELLDKPNIFSNLYDKDPDEFQLGKYDVRVRNLFGEDNRLTLKELENKVYEKYAESMSENDLDQDKIDTEIDILKNRIHKLALNGHLTLDKETGTYSFTEDSDNYFVYDEEKEAYFYTPEAIEELNISVGLEFTRYDANVTLGYIDRCEDGILRLEKLHQTLHEEIANQRAQVAFNRINELLNTDIIDKVKEYVSIDSQGNMTSTEKGRALGISLNKVNYYFYKAPKGLSEDALKDLCKDENKFETVKKQIKELVKAGHVIQDESGYRINPVMKDINTLLYQIYKEGGTLNQADLKAVLEKNIKNQEAENQYQYLEKKLKFLVEEGILKRNDGGFSITEAGVEKRADLLVPERKMLRKNLNYLQKLGFIKITDGKYQATEKYYTYKEKLHEMKKQKIERVSPHIKKEICRIIDQSLNRVSVGKIERNYQKTARGKYLQDEYQSIKTSYDDVRKSCNVADVEYKTVNRLATTLLVAGVDQERTKEILHQWNIRAGTKISEEKLEEAINKANQTVHENNRWEKTTVITKKDWEEMFKVLGVGENDMPKWIYKGENWKDFNFKGPGIISIVNDIWKSSWAQLERERRQREFEVESLKKAQAKQAANENKAARKENIRKLKNRGLYQEDELE